MNTSTEKCLLAIGAHHDDCEGAAGGLILKAVQRGYRVVLVTLTGDHASWRPTRGRETAVRQDLLAIARDMGVEKRFLEWRYHHATYNEKNVLELRGLVADLRPQLALIHWPYDYWPDHEAAGKLARHALWFPDGGDAAKPRLLMFTAGQNQTDPAVPFRPDVNVDVTGVMDEAGMITRRLDGVAGGYPVTRESPLSTHEKDMLAKSRLRGTECGVTYAEAYCAVGKAPIDIL